MYIMYYYSKYPYRGEEKFVIRSKMIDDLEDADKYYIYYISDTNGNIILDNRNAIDPNEEF